MEIISRSRNMHSSLNNGNNAFHRSAHKRDVNMILE